MNNHNFRHAIKIIEAQCIGCVHCMQVCPTQAIRVRGGKAEINSDKCIDCGECMRVCPMNAITVQQDDFEKIFNYKYRVALIPAVFISQFNENISEELIYNVLHELGFTHIYEVEQSVDYIIKEINQQLLNSKIKKPAISTFCPAIIRLIQVQFPALADNILLVKSPVDLSAVLFRKQLIDAGLPENEIGLFYITPCAAKIASIKNPENEMDLAVDGVIKMDFIYNKILKKISNNIDYTDDNQTENNSTERSIKWSLTTGEICNVLGNCLAIDEIHNVIEFLDKLEDDEFDIFDFLELRACDGSCAGGILASENRFIAIERTKRRAEKYRHKNKQISNTNIERFIHYNKFLKENIRISKIKTHSMHMLDDDMDKALEKIQAAQKIYAGLPKIDCGACGSPSCAVFAEDVVMKRAKISQCVFYQLKRLNNLD